MCLQEIHREIIEIRNCYEEGSTQEYSNDQLARMMLLDACFIAAHMARMTFRLELDDGQYRHRAWRIFELINLSFGPLNAAIALRDMCLADNQIPLWIVKLLLSIFYTPRNEQRVREEQRVLHEQRVPLTNNQFPFWIVRMVVKLLLSIFYTPRNEQRALEEQRELEEQRAPEEQRAQRAQRVQAVLDRYLTRVLFGGFYPARRPQQGINGEKLHLLEYLHSALTRDANADLAPGERGRPRTEEEEDRLRLAHSFRSLQELKAKGILLEPSPTQSLRDINFRSNCIYAKLQLPTWSARPNIKTLLLNMMCYELDPQTLSSGIVISYINLMKLLIVKPEDVKELREKNILLGSRGTDEEIAKMYQDLNTYGADNPYIYGNLKHMIQAHCDSTAKTWMAERFYTYFRGPWTRISFLAATCLLVLTILQTVYTMKSYTKKS
ncbi:hypothetical protein CDL12_10411 [Handroanthus impetiginosus]|uniref:Uncharacterized protein n=1 Tax=Handroanthus impetiginosus TaxID=429701 RepID=A0A2G9HI10_9LAMI|nr:hypothetical protein CDL12_10411 [Handroanthus impetiginosus]